MLKTAEKFSDDVYDFILTISDVRKSNKTCIEPIRASLGFKCLSYKKKFTIIFIETEMEIIVCEFVASKLIYW